MSLSSHDMFGMPFCHVRQSMMVLFLLFTLPPSPSLLPSTSKCVFHRIESSHSIPPFNSSSFSSEELLPILQTHHCTHPHTCHPSYHPLPASGACPAIAESTDWSSSPSRVCREMTPLWNCLRRKFPCFASQDDQLNRPIKFP